MGQRFNAFQVKHLEKNHLFEIKFYSCAPFLEIVSKDFERCFNGYKNGHECHDD